MRALALILCALGVLHAATAVQKYPDYYNEEHTASSSSSEFHRVPSRTFSSASDRDDKSANDEAPKFAGPNDLSAAKSEWEQCPAEMFMRSPGKCHPCSGCGPDLYTRVRCTATRDTVCDWCLNPAPSRNANFRLKCTDVIRLQEDFNELLKKRYGGGATKKSSSSQVSDRLNAFAGWRSSSSSKAQQSSSASSSQQDEDVSYVSDAQMPVRISVIRPIYGEIDETDRGLAKETGLLRFTRLRSFMSTTYKLEFLMELGLYAVLISLLYAVIRFITKAAHPRYRTITVNPPVLDESDKKNIIRAADEIRDKLGKKGYNRLEEFI